MLLGGKWSAGLARIREVAKSPAAQAQVEPITGDIELTYRYPAYTGLAQRTVPGTNTFRLVAGTYNDTAALTVAAYSAWR